MSGLNRSGGTPISQFVPGDDHELLPIGNADAQVAEAMRIAKEQNRRPEVGMTERIAKMDAMNVNTAMDFLDDQSPYERERYLQAEKQSKGRVTILGRWGW